MILNMVKVIVVFLFKIENKINYVFFNNCFLMFLLSL